MPGTYVSDTTGSAGSYLPPTPTPPSLSPELVAQHTTLKAELDRAVADAQAALSAELADAPPEPRARRLPTLTSADAYEHAGDALERRYWPNRRRRRALQARHAHPLRLPRLLGDQAPSLVRGLGHDLAPLG